MAKAKLNYFLLALIIFSIIISTVAYIKASGNQKINQKIDLETEYFTLNNTNYGIHKKVIDFICTPGLYVRNLPSQKYFYASAWKDADVHEGECMVKYEVNKW